ncbi:MAG: Hsp70 suppressor, GTPase facilitates ribosomal subunit dissociation [Bathelium mastoideum]|nr:MAG: Hsp70 suppressor, GTPase facilitates ribosomal subunit dissociation [Bathelium mastoideum]
MSNRRVKDIAYDEDDWDGLDDDVNDEFDQDEGWRYLCPRQHLQPDLIWRAELSPEDQQQMALGKIEVRKALGDIPVSDREIEAMLWEYYYDVPQSVKRLKQQYESTRPKQPKQQQPKSEKAPAAIQSGTTSRSADFFKDTPWLNVPLHLQAEIIVEPLFPRGGLLGGASGSGKSSKLAQLAAARKKKEEEKKAQERAPQSSQSSSNAISLLDRLSNNPTSKERANDDSTPQEIIRKRKATPQPSSANDPIKSAPTQSARKEPAEERPDTAEEKSDPIPSEEFGNTLRANPSSFAATLTGINIPRVQPSFGRQYSIPFFQFTGYNMEILRETNNAFSGPSPDDIIEQAQAKGKSNAGKKDSKKTSDPTEEATQGVSDMTLQEPSKKRIKTTDVVSEFRASNMKSSASFVVVGHVDHGKSTLMGRLLLDLQVVEQRTIDKFRKEAETMGKSSFALAWVMDQTSDERSHGITVDIATHFFETSQTRFTILDAPGHRDFVPNMIAGASQADFALLVIDAGPDSFESGLKGQTKEHALLIRALGVSQIVIAVNKMDVTGWDQQRFDTIRQQLSAFLARMGFPATTLVFVPCAGLTGANVVTRVDHATAPWSNSAFPSLVEALDAAALTTSSASRALDQPFRMPLAEVFHSDPNSDGGAPNTLAGRIASGTCQVGTRILVQPSGATAAIAALEIDNTPAQWAVAGMRATLRLGQVAGEGADLRPGDVVCDSEDRPLVNVSAFSVKLLAFEALLPELVEVHFGRMHVPGRVAALVAVLDPQTGQPKRAKKPRVVMAGETALVKVRLDGAKPVEPGLRVVLRSQGKTMAAGSVTETD